MSINSPDAIVSIFNQTNNGPVTQNFNFSGIDAEKVRETIAELIPESPVIHWNKQLFKWAQTNFENPKTGNKGYIDNINRYPLKVTFDNDLIKKDMTASSDDIEWQRKFYQVDVEVQYADGKPKVYKILRNYPEEAFAFDKEDELV